MASKTFLTARDIQGIIGCSESFSYTLIKKLNAELEEQGYITLRGKVPRKYLETRIYGGVNVDDRENSNVGGRNTTSD